MIAAPYCATILGEFGAEVLKVEHPIGGDACALRHADQARRHADLAVARRATRSSVTIDLHRKEGVELFKQLIAKTDVLCENFRPGTLEKWGLGWEVLQQDSTPG